ncbi:MAG TPA: DNA polymerase III subunit gamma/tau [Anaerolineae bacterium]|nr:DNA polymerase III subunit gamma/tau [Anaerolineae bacterium]
MTQALYRKWRPQTFDDVVGQEHIVRTLRNALHAGHLHHAYLLAGPRGTGKTTTARLIAKAVNCLAPVGERPCDQCEICQAITAGRLMDLVEIDAASNTGVDNIRDLLEKVGFRPAQAQYKVYVVDEVHMLSTAAFNALLKTLEEPPEHVIFVLATTEVHKIPETILSRCQRFEFRRIPLAQLVGRLQAIAEAENIQAEQEALDLIARAATGSMRDAISLFDQMAAGGDVTADYVRLMLGAERREVVQSLLQAWLAGDLGAGVAVINRAVDGGADPRQLARQTADFLRGLLLMRLGAGEMWTDPTTEERPHFQDMARAAKPERLVAAIRLFSQVAAISRTGWQPQLPLELAFVEATLTPAPPAAPAIAQPVAAPPAAAPSAAPAPAARRVRSVQPSARAHTSTTAERAKEPTTAVEVSGAPASAEVSPELLSAIRERWRQMMGHIQSVKLAALSRDAQIAGVDSAGKLVLLFQHSFHRDNVNQDDNRRMLETLLSETFKQPIYVRCMLEKEWETQSKKAAAPPPTDAGQPAARSRTTTPPEPPPPPDDELVRRAQEELGAVPKFSE